MKKIIIRFFLSAVMSLTFLGGANAQPRENILKIYNWGDYIDEDLLGEFEEWYKEQTGEEVHIIYQLFDINEIMLAKIEKGHADFDLACPSDYIIERMLRNDLLLPINKEFGEGTPNWLSNISPYVIEKFNGIQSSGKNPADYVAGYMWGTTGFLFNKKYVSADKLKSWSALWNPEFDQKILVKDAFRDVYSPLLMYINNEKILSGEVDREELMYDTSDESIAAVEALMMQAKPYVLGWEADFGKEMMTQEKAWVNLSWSGDAKWAMDEATEVGVDLGYIIPQEGSNVWFDGWVIPKYAKNIKAASYFINFMCKPENVIRNMEAIGYVSACATPEILEAMKEMAIEEGCTDSLDVRYFFGEEAGKVVLNPVFYPDQADIERCTLMHDTGDRTEALLEMWARVKGNQLDYTTIAVLVILVLGIAAVVVSRRAKKNRRK